MKLLYNKKELFYTKTELLYFKITLPLANGKFFKMIFLLIPSKLLPYCYSILVN